MLAASGNPQIAMAQLPLNPLRVFAAAARHRSFSAAGDELSITPSAVSHAVKKLESSLGALLFDRDGRALELTPVGETLFAHVIRGFDELQRGLEKVYGRSEDLLRFHCAPSFAAQWLMPRFSGFNAEHPDIKLQLAANSEWPKLLNDEFDLAISYGPPRYEGHSATSLGQEVVTPVCTAAIAAKLTSLLICIEN